jgi:tetratricopeptide (TPR) repeat protein
MAQSLTNIGSTLELQGRFREAEPYYRQALDIRRKSQVPDHPEIAGLINKLAQSLFKQGRYGEADRLFAECIEMRYRMQPADHPEIAISLTDSAVNLAALKRHDEAKQQLRNALAIRQSVLPPLSPAIAETQVALAKVELAQGHVEQALSQIRVAAVALAARAKNDDIAKQSFSDFVSIAWQVYDKQGRNNPASRLFAEALEMAQRASLTDTESEVARMTARFAANDAALEAAIRDRQELERGVQRSERELSAALALSVQERGSLADEIRADLVSLGQRIKSIDDDIRRRFPSYFALVSPEPISLDDMRAMLAPGEIGRAHV